MGEASVSRKTREVRNHHIDSTVWNDFEYRDGDIVIASYAKAGTTWLQQIVAQLLFDAAEDLPVAEMSPWLELRILPRKLILGRLAAQTHRRFVKTHLPTDALAFSKRAKYVYIGRDGRDIVWSLYHHHRSANETWYKGLNDLPGRVGPPIEKPPDSVRQYYHDWLQRDGFPLWPFWENVRSWWNARHLPNVELVHFNNLKQDLPGQIRRIADFLDTPVDEETWETILLHCSFDYMKQYGKKTVILDGNLWDGGFQAFIHKGTNGRWIDVLEPGEIAEYENLASKELGADCARWLATGELPG